MMQRINKREYKQNEIHIIRSINIRNGVFLFGTCFNLFHILCRHWQLPLLALQGISSLRNRSATLTPHKARSIVNLNVAPGSLPFHYASDGSKRHRSSISGHFSFKIPT